jgi:hypothetical protein
VHDISSKQIYAQARAYAMSYTKLLSGAESAEMLAPIFTPGLTRGTQSNGQHPIC